MYVPPFKVRLQNKELIKASHELGVKLMHRIWMRDAHTGIIILDDVKLDGNVRFF